VTRLSKLLHDFRTANGWFKAKVLICAGCFLLAAIFDDAGSDVSDMPGWAAGIFVAWGFVMGIGVRFNSRSGPWTEYGLWSANPVQYMLYKFKHPEWGYWPPFYHWGAINGLAMGAGCLVKALFARPPQLPLYAAWIFLGSGGMLWLGLRCKDWFRR
jgi:hypothetical protein